MMNDQSNRQLEVRDAITLTSSSSLSYQHSIQTTPFVFAYCCQMQTCSLTTIIVESIGTADKQQEDLDLPYLTNQEQLQQSGAILIDSNQQQQQQQSNQSQHQHQQQLASSQSQSSLVAGQQPITPSNISAKQHQSEDAMPINLISQKEQQQAANEQSNNNCSLTINKIASSSNVLSSVSLASGAQMKQNSAITIDAHTGEQIMPSTDCSSKINNATVNNKATTDSAANVASHTVNAAASSDLITVDNSSSSNNLIINKNNKQESEIIDNQLESITKLEEEKSDHEKSEQQQLALVGRDPQIQTPKPKINELKHLLRHTNSLNQLPEFGVETENEQELSNLMEQIDVWGLNIFEVHRFSHQHSLTAVMYKIFKVSKLNIFYHFDKNNNLLTITLLSYYEK